MAVEQLLSSKNHCVCKRARYRKERITGVHGQMREITRDTELGHTRVIRATHENRIYYKKDAGPVNLANLPPPKADKELAFLPRVDDHVTLSTATSPSANAIHYAHGYARSRHNPTNIQRVPTRAHAGCMVKSV